MGKGRGGEEAQTRTLLFPHVPIPVSNMEVKTELSFGEREIWNLPPAAVSGVNADRQNQQGSVSSLSSHPFLQHFFWLLQAIHTPCCESHIVKHPQQSPASAQKLQNLNRQSSLIPVIDLSQDLQTHAQLPHCLKLGNPATVEVVTGISTQGITSFS